MTNLHPRRKIQLCTAHPRASQGKDACQDEERAPTRAEQALDRLLNPKASLHKEKR